MSVQPWENPATRYTPRRAVHRPCGLELPKVDVTPDAAEVLAVGYVWLNPLEYPGQGDVALTELGATLVGGRAGDRFRHLCPALTRPCKTCGQAIVLLHQAPGAEYHLAFADPEPVPDGSLIIDADGVAWCDPHHTYEWDGPRYRHHGHTRAERLAARRGSRHVTVINPREGAAA